MQEPLELDNTVDDYVITVATMPIGCTADVADMISTLDNSQRDFMVSDLEEFSMITINITARNSIGETSSAQTVETASAGKLISHALGFFISHVKTW